MFNLGSMLNLGSTEPVVGKAHTIVECPANEIFQYLGEGLFENYPKWSPEVKELEQITPGPVKLGTEGRQVRVDQGRRTESKFKVSTYEPGVRLALIGISDSYRCTYELQAINPGNSTKLTFSFELLEILPIMRPLEGLIRVTIKDGSERTVQNIKRLVETEKNKKASVNQKSL